MPTYPPVESVTRAIRLLSRLNQREVTSLTELYQAMRIPKPSLVRLLDTLISIGYVRHDPARRGYRLEPAVRELSDGFHSGPLLVEAGAAACVELTRQLKWVVSIAVLAGAETMICYTTLRDSPMSPFGRVLDRRRDLLTTALGRAYIAYCPEAERRILATMLKAGKDAAARRAIDATLRDVVEKAARQDYVEREPGAVSRVTTTIGMPIRADRRILGTIGMTFFTSAIRRDELNQAIVAPLREAALTIGSNAHRLIRQRRARTARDWSDIAARDAVPPVHAGEESGTILSPGPPA